MIEVLSPSTEKQDRGAKFKHYWTIPSLREYILIDQDAYRLERYARHPEEPEIYLFEVYSTPDALITLAAIDCTLLLTDVYEKVIVASETTEND